MGNDRMDQFLISPIFPTKRPQIPAGVEHEVLFESGHRCAVCGEPCPLERAHIIPWCKSHEHRPEDLICLCANCHQRADNEKWGEAVLRKYKQNPWVLRRSSERKSPTVKIIEIEIKMKLSEFSGKEEILKYALSAFLGISPQEVVITSIKEGSVKITIELPGDLGSELLKAHENEDSELDRALSSFGSPDIRQLGFYMIGNADTLTHVENCEEAREVMFNAIAIASMLNIFQLAVQPPVAVEDHAGSCLECAAKLRLTRLEIYRTTAADVDLIGEGGSEVKLLKERLISVWSVPPAGGGGIDPEGRDDDAESAGSTKK